MIRQQTYNLYDVARQLQISKAKIIQMLLDEERLIPIIQIGSAVHGYKIICNNQLFAETSITDLDEAIDSMTLDYSKFISLVKFVELKF